MDQKTQSPFTFNHAWLQDKSFISLFEKNWRKFHYDVGSSMMYQFSNNLIRIKKLKISWAKDKLLGNQNELKEVKETIEVIFDQNSSGIFSKEEV